MRFAALATAMSDIAHDVVSLSHELGAQEATPAAVSVSHLEVEKSSFFNPSNVKKLIAAIKASKCDVLCTYNWGAIEAVIANSLGLRKPHLHFEDGFGPDENLDRQNVKRVLARRFLLRGSIVSVPSKGLAELARKRWRLPARRVRYTPNGIDLARFSAATRDAARNSISIGAIGALRPEKNFARLIRAFAVADLGRDGRLVIYGEGPERERLRRAATEAGLDADVVLAGRTNAPARVYPDFDIFALTSDTEQMPLAMMEAMAAGLPVLGVDVGDVLEMVSPENRPFIYDRTDETGIAVGLSQLASDSALRRKIGEANAQRAREAFSLDGMVAAHRALIDEALAQRR